MKASGFRDGLNKVFLYFGKEDEGAVDRSNTRPIVHPTTLFTRTKTRGRQTVKFVERGLFAMEQIDCSAGNGHCQRTARGLGGRVTGPEGPFPHSAEGKGGPGCHFT